MQNPTQNFRQSSIVFEKPGILSKKNENFDELQLPLISELSVWNSFYVV